MTIVLILIGALLVVSAIRNSQGALFGALVQDVPEYVIWAAAIFAVGALGWVPGLKPVSRGLLALVLIVIVLNNYQNIISGFSAVWQSPPKPETANDNKKSGGTSGPVFGSGIISENNLHTFEEVAPYVASAF